MMTLDPIRQPLPPVRTWIVRGTKSLPGGGSAAYLGTSWGRTEAEARQSHARLRQADLRIRQDYALNEWDLDGYTWEFEPVTAAVL